MNKPKGYIAICQCGSAVGAIDLTQTERSESGKILGQWVANGFTLIPRFPGTWSVNLSQCKCNDEEANQNAIEGKLNSQKGKTIRSVNYYECIGTLEVHTTDGTCFRVQAEAMGKAAVMIVEP